MAMKRKKGAIWEYCVKRAGVTPKPIYLRFADEAEGDDYVARLEKMLAAGILPPEFAADDSAPKTISQAIDAYTLGAAISDMDERLLISLERAIGKTALMQIDYPWAERFLRTAKQVEHLAPGTIRHQVGALARMFDWLARRGQLLSNPLRLLPKGYATYTAGDEAVLAAAGKPARKDTERDRRLGADEEKAIRAIMAGAKPEGRERAFTMNERDKLVLLFDLALETAMRLRELYTLTADQVDLPRRTIFLDKTKNGSKRQVPLSSVAVGSLQGSTLPSAGQVFPWWNGESSETELRRVSSLLSRQFARIFSAAGCADLHFHDLRHEATSRLFERTTLSELEIAKITGHSSSRMLMRYANLRGSALAQKLW